MVVFQKVWNGGMRLLCRGCRPLRYHLQIWHHQASAHQKWQCILSHMTSLTHWDYVIAVGLLDPSATINAHILGWLQRLLVPKHPKAFPWPTCRAVASSQSRSTRRARPCRARAVNFSAAGPARCRRWVVRSQATRVVAKQLRWMREILRSAEIILGIFGSQWRNHKVARKDFVVPNTCNQERRSSQNFQHKYKQ